MTVKQARSEFLDSLDRQTLQAINQRIEKLAPLVDEHRELCRRKNILEAKYGMGRTGQRIMSLLTNYPEGLSIGEMTKMLSRESGPIRSSCSDLVKSGHLIRVRPGVFVRTTSTDNSD